VKLYGGEPTLHHRHLIEVLETLRGMGYRGRWTVFSNGVQAGRLVEMLEADPPCEKHAGSDAYLNYRIWHGLGVEPIPEGRRRTLEHWGRENPGRLWLSHEDVLPVGGGEGAAPTPLPDTGDLPDFAGACARCWPTVRSDGRLHACAFAAEVESPLYDLGHAEDEPARVAKRHADFLRWIEETLEPEARARGEAPCTTCLRRARTVSGLVRIEAR